MELKQEHHYDINPLLEIASIKRSTFYYQKSLLSKEDKYDEAKKLIVSTYHQHKGRYGYRRITFVLRNQHSLRINHKTVQKLMKELNLASKIRSKRYQSYKGEVGTTTPNLLLDKVVDEQNNKTTYVRNFQTLTPNEKWTTDVTEFKVCGVKMYLSPLLDMYDHCVISYQVSKTPNLHLVTDMIEEALQTNQINDLILHSDQGWQYQHRKYQQILSSHEIKQSMSRKGNCLDNSIIENFFSHLKSEFYYLEEFISIDDFIKKLDNYINYYNNERLSLKLKGLTPIQYRNQSLHCNFL